MLIHFGKANVFNYLANEVSANYFNSFNYYKNYAYECIPPKK